MPPMAGDGGGGGGREHLVQITNGGSGQGKVDEPEKRLNRFVRAVVMLERMGNALGTLAFTWATTVLLGGYASDLRDDDFMFATILIFLEAARYVYNVQRLLHIAPSKLSLQPPNFTLTYPCCIKCHRRLAIYA